MDVSLLNAVGSSTSVIPSKLNKEGYQIVVSDILENNQYNSGIDLADLILETKNKSQKER